MARFCGFFDQSANTTYRHKAKSARVPPANESTVPFPVRPCAEFPNDNDVLHDGSVWVCARPTASARAVLRARATRRITAALQSGERVAPAQTACPALDVNWDHCVTATLGNDHPPPTLASSPVHDVGTSSSSSRSKLDVWPQASLRWSELISLLEEYLTGLGQASAAAFLHAVLDSGAASEDDAAAGEANLSAATIGRLEQSGIAVRRAGGVVLTPSFSASVGAFRRAFDEGNLRTTAALLWLAQFMAALVGDAFEPDDLRHGLERLDLAQWLKDAA